VGFYIAIWAISRYAVTHISSYYYNVSHRYSPSISGNHTANGCSLSATPSKNTANFASDPQLRAADSVALSLIYSWIMWKLPFSLFILHLAFEQPNRILKYVSWAISLVLMLAVDLLLTIFVYNYYQEYMFFAFSAVLGIAVSMINNRDKLLSAFAAGLIPPLLIAFLYACYTYFIPALYMVFVENVNNGYQYLMIYGYPVIDLLLYTILLLCNAKGPVSAKPMLSFVQFMLLGYFCGIAMQASITEVEFYYLCAYMLFRNFFTNWVMYKWEDIVNNPSCLPGWAIVYYLSYAFSFLPIIGLGPLVVSQFFKSNVFCSSCLLLYYYPSTAYPRQTSLL
jgi:hypothetical protein